MSYEITVVADIMLKILLVAAIFCVISFAKTWRSFKKKLEEDNKNDESNF